MRDFWCINKSIYFKIFSVEIQLSAIYHIFVHFYAIFMHFKCREVQKDLKNCINYLSIMVLILMIHFIKEINIYSFKKIFLRYRCHIFRFFCSLNCHTVAGLKYIKKRKRENTYMYMVILYLSTLKKQKYYYFIKIAFWSLFLWLPLLHALKLQSSNFPFVKVIFCGDHLFFETINMF